MNRRTIKNNQGSVSLGNDPMIINANIINNDSGNPFYVKHVGPDGPDNIYVNITVMGANTGNPTQPHKTFSFSQRFSEAIIKNIQHYYLSIVSLGFSSTEVPLHIMNNIQPGPTQTNPNLTDWSFCFEFNNITYQDFVEYIPYNNMPVPPPPSTNPPEYTQFHTNYYFVDHYNVLVRMFNQTLQTIYTNMFNANVAAFGIIGLTANDYPFFIYDENDEKFKLIYNKLFVANSIDLFFSDSFNVFFPGFYTYYNGTGTNNCKDFRVIFENAPDNVYDPTRNVNSQMYSGSPSNLNTINQIVITSNTLRTAFEFATNDVSINNYTYNNVIFSLLPNLETPKNSKSRLVYVTNGTYRLIDIISEGSINQLDFNVYYTDNKGIIYPISIPDGMIGNAKIIFIKKSQKNLIF